MKGRSAKKRPNMNMLCTPGVEGPEVPPVEVEGKLHMALGLPTRTTHVSFWLSCLVSW